MPVPVVGALHLFLQISSFWHYAESDRRQTTCLLGVFDALDNVPVTRWNVSKFELDISSQHVFRLLRAPNRWDLVVTPFEQARWAGPVRRRLQHGILEGLSKHRNRPYQFKVKNPTSPALPRAKGVEWSVTAKR